jgi:hypothetical protein
VSTEQVAGLERVAEEFRRFGAVEISATSPLYARLSAEIAHDPFVLSIAADAKRGQPRPNMLFAAVHFLLLSGEHAELSAWYPSLGSSRPPPSDPYPAFRAFCVRHEQALRRLIAERRVQTNVVGRCAVLLPALHRVALEAGQPLGLVEIGASAGLNLLFDHFAYRYIPGGNVGAPDSPLELRCEVRGTHFQVPGALPPVKARRGIDLHPVDVSQADEVRWLDALVWPEEWDRRRDLRLAIEIARRHPPEVIQGDALDVLGSVLEDLPAGLAGCVVHSFTLNQFSREARAQFAALLRRAASTRPIWVVSLEFMDEGSPVLSVTRFEHGRNHRSALARCQPHGRWLEWLGS